MIIMPFPHLNGYEIAEKVGVGSFSVVYKAYTKTNPKEVVAIKCIDKRYQQKSFADNVVKEISLLKLLKHDYIVRLIDFQSDSKYIFIITEFCDEGDLSHYIRKKHKLAESLVKTFMQQLALALKFLRSHNICHMDLKPQNLLLRSKPKLQLKVADFGLSQIISPQNAEQSRFAGSLLYMAPEKLLNQHYDARVDLWSVGIIMFECLFGRNPFLNMNTKAIVDLMLKRGPIELPPNANITPVAEDLLFKLLKHNPDERINFEQFFEHPFLDLIHMATPENYHTAVSLIQEAIELDKSKQYSECLDKYKEAVRYLEAFIPLETNPNRKAMLALRLSEYTKRITALNDMLSGKENSKLVATDLQPLPLTDDQFDMLRGLSTLTPNMATGLDIGCTGELYMVEGKNSLALEKLTSALSLLIPILGNEPPGVRKDLLHAQVQKWLSLAESLKKVQSTSAS
ncbi:serine/threonine-protein kinase ULK3 [Agrilus planipennis]|uniref:Serine/threonine-protein kinase ULK3 n=1 Tax=Agrilus planipennis TaxID=224129 RepID=A0A1W4XI56_AGRPL|nr:serine/threonine-protein kinase ULK3 [Agrilus planipennis]